MNKVLYFFLCIPFIIISACSHRYNIKEVKNMKKGLLKGGKELHLTEVKLFALDSNTAPKAQYTAIYTDSSGKRNFTFLNKNNHSIYFYDYRTLKFLKKITLVLPTEETFNPAAYYIKNIDSIYVYNMAGLDLLIANREGVIYNRLSLINNKNIRDLRWVLNYPQYYPQAAVPFIATSDVLLLPGQYMQTLPDSLIDSFKFIAYIDLKHNRVDFYHKYPSSLYGYNYNWCSELFTQVYVDLCSNKNQLVFSFPVSHDLYIANLSSSAYKKVYGGSNIAGTISSMNVSPKEVTRQVALEHFANNDEYGAIKYDPFRKVYYRFLRRAVPDSVTSVKWKEKPVVVIIFDRNFHYLGETNIGTLKNWYLQDAFVTKEGLNIEYVDNNINEDSLILKIFTLKEKS